MCLRIVICIDSFHLQQSPSGIEKMGKTATENPNLNDNWDDAEGYYRKIFNNFLSINIFLGGKFAEIVLHFV